jgi:hypothetical protein
MRQRACPIRTEELLHIIATCDGVDSRFVHSADPELVCHAPGGSSYLRSFRLIGPQSLDRNSQKHLISVHRLPRSNSESRFFNLDRALNSVTATTACDVPINAAISRFPCSST